MNQPTAYLESYGCQMNLADSELIEGQLSANGYRIVKDPKTADVLLVNTCAIREHAEDRVIARLSELAAIKERRANVALVVCGCVAQQQKAALKERLPALDLIVGPDAYRSLPTLLESRLGRRQHVPDCVLRVRLDRSETYSGITPQRQPGPSAWVTIMRGCDRFCTFCVVPYVRGRERSRPAREILEEVEGLAGAGYREVVFLGQTVTSYRQGNVDFSGLLRQAARVEGIERIRFTSPHPADISDDVIETIATSKKVAPHLHLPLQAGSDHVLRRMNRDYTVASFLKKVERLREAIPDLALSTDVIVGFPDETRDDFEATMAVLKQVEFDHAFMFKYSRRLHTKAYGWADSVSELEKQARLVEVIEMQEKISAARNRRWIGREVEVLVEGRAKRQPDWASGKTPHFKTTVIPCSLKPGALIRTTISRTTAHTLVGEPPAESTKLGLHCG